MRRRVHRIVRANHQHGIGIGEIIIDLVHLQHDVIRHFRLRQQHVHMPRQATRHRMNAETHVDPARAQFFGDFRHRILRLRYRHPIPRRNNDGVGVFQHLSGLFRRDFAMFASFLIVAR
ncbi:Uncharacterised protein [Salmonella enterica subsp. enterica serovar Bovismorbificans]|uniref:Uncharacterized protein n=1 Tax=Salmonella enterica subsp. enterica serovar Bovismorbificans TaxID=58097 RepID=A0A655EDL6_SALET|nr:Uncharacterised protein [Salmonella enterica subsp. enterica serovar Bovismorbificans]CNV14936.1 Uncharacterised protein [Salmonella enterica subsp. enterica serovar Bovismorbificans]